MVKNKEVKTEKPTTPPDEVTKAKEPRPHKDLDREAIQFINDRLAKLEKRFNAFMIYYSQQTGQSF